MVPSTQEDLVPTGWCRAHRETWYLVNCAEQKKTWYIINGTEQNKMRVLWIISSEYGLEHLMDNVVNSTGVDMHEAT